MRKLSFEGAGLQSRQKMLKRNRALAPEGMLRCAIRDSPDRPRATVSRSGSAFERPMIQEHFPDANKIQWTLADLPVPIFPRQGRSTNWRSLEERRFSTLGIYHGLIMQPMTNRFTLELQKLERDSHDACSRCGRHFNDGETSHSGYDAESRSLYVGDCCASRIQETAARYCWTKHPYESPSDGSSLWRYMDLAKFVSLLRDRSIYFARADILGDSWEGAKGARSNKTIWDAHYLRFFQEAIRNPPEGHQCEKSDEEVEAEANRLLEQLEVGGSFDLRRTYVSCWHENEIESEALWRLYCPPPTAGIAIRTTFADLKRVFDNDLSVRIGRVKYVDFRTQFAGINDAIFRKRKSLQHEQEVRAVICKHPEDESTNLTRQVELPALIKEVVVSPFSPAWLESIVSDLLQRYEAPIPIRTSELLLQPFF